MSRSPMAVLTCPSLKCSSSKVLSSNGRPQIAILKSLILKYSSSTVVTPKPLKAYYAFYIFTINIQNIIWDPYQGRFVLAYQYSYYDVYRPFYIIATIIPIACYIYVRQTIQKILGLNKSQTTNINTVSQQIIVKTVMAL
uniref:Uncharacterized protein n=1 Tax=Acrobeloides nanus TaxID=290746 RepID=A0A914DPM7_9BILA